MGEAINIPSYNNISVLTSDGYVVMLGPLSTSSVMTCDATNKPTG